MDRISNPNSASEGRVGGIHEKITEIHELSLDSLLKLAKDNPEEAMYVFDNRVVDRAQKWVEYNQIGPQLAEESDTELSRKLKRIRETQKGKIIQFTDEATG